MLTGEWIILLTATGKICLPLPEKSAYRQRKKLLDFCSLGILGFNGSFYAGMLKGDMEAGINTVSSAASLIKSIDSCEEIVNELARGYGC